MKNGVRRLSGASVVVTGASSGTGRAAALEFAREGARLVLAARREEALEELARECRNLGGEAIVVVTDVTREADVQRLARTAIEKFDGIDIWVNNAGVTLFAFLEELPFEEHEAVIRTNLFGAMHGARAVLPHFRERRRGVLINVGSVLSKVAQPFVPSYVISKFGLRGLSEALRAEVAELRDIHVCTVYPYAIDTPHFEEGATKGGRRAHPMPPTQSPEKVARAIVSLAIRPRRELHVPRVAQLGVALHGLFPRTTERILYRALARWHFDETPQPATDGNLHTPRSETGAAHGTRGPRIGLLAFIVWVLGDFVKMQLEDARLVRGSLAQ